MSENEKKRKTFIGKQCKILRKGYEGLTGNIENIVISATSGKIILYSVRVNKDMLVGTSEIEII